MNSPCTDLMALAKCAKGVLVGENDLREKSLIYRMRHRGDEHRDRRIVLVGSDDVQRRL